MIPSIILAATFVLHWSAIGTNAGPDCTFSAVAFSVPVTYHVRSLNQRAYYLAHRDSMLDNRTPYFTAHWPQVRAEAEPVTVAATLDTFATVKDTTGTFYVVAVKPSGAESPCRGSMVSRP